MAVKNYHWFSYRISYEGEITDLAGNVILSVNQNGAVCFRTVFDKLYYYKSTLLVGNYTIHCRKKFKVKSGNFCALSRDEILKVLRYMRRTLDIKIYFSEDEDYYHFKFHVEGYPVKHRYVLTFSRVFYEFPFNELAKDIMRLRAKRVYNGVNFSNKSFLELYNLVSATYVDDVYNGHSLFKGPSLNTKTADVQKAFNNPEVFRVNDVCPGQYQILNQTIHMKRNMRDIDWDDGFRNRIEKYSENFQILKTLKQNAKGIRRRNRKAV